MYSSNELDPESPVSASGSMDHVIEILASHNHPAILVGCSAQRWMGSQGTMSSRCDLLIRDSAVEKVASDLVETGHWEFYMPDPQTPEKSVPTVEFDADLVLRRTEIQHESEYQYLNLWSENTYRISVDDCPILEVPDLYPWHPILAEETWHPAIDRGNGWWFGPRLHPDTKVPNLPEYAKQHTIFSKGLPRGKDPSNNFPIFIPSLPAHLDALIYQVTQYQHSKPELASFASWAIGNLTRYLYLELPHQQLRLLIELEEDEFMDHYLQNYKRKPVFVYRTAPGTDSELESTRVKEWDPSSYPDWCGITK